MGKAVDRQAGSCKILAGLRAGDGLRSVRARPSSIKRDRDRRTTSTGKMPGERTCKVTLDPGDHYGHSGQNQGPGASLPGPDTGHPLHRAGSHHDPEYTRNEPGHPEDKRSGWCRQIA